MAARSLICRTLLVVSAFVDSGCYRSNVSTKIYAKAARSGGYRRRTKHRFYRAPGTSKASQRRRRASAF
jgi:hypothetical protein